MANASEGSSQQFTEVNALNSKLMLDEQLDNRRELLARSRAWESLQFRVANDAATISHAINAGIVLSGQVGTTSAQQTVSPVRTGSGDNLAAGSVPANRIVDETGAVAAGGIDSATAQATLNNVTAQLGELTALVDQLAQNIKQSSSAQNSASLMAILAPFIASLAGSKAESTPPTA